MTSTALSLLTDDFNAVLRDRANKGIGTALFVLNVPRSPQAHQFPAPLLHATPFEFLDWSDKPEGSVPRKIWDQEAHSFLATQGHKRGVLLFGVIGPMEQLYTWAQLWLNESSKVDYLKQWLKGAVWLNHKDLLDIDERMADLSGKPDVIDNTPVDLDDPDFVKNLAKLTPLEKDALAENPELNLGRDIDYDDAAEAEATEIIEKAGGL